MKKERVFINQINCYEFSLFPWTTVLSHIFFEFMESGGQEYFILCDYCKRFSKVEKKNKKKYCSSKCKDRYHYRKKNQK